MPGLNEQITSFPGKQEVETSAKESSRSTYNSGKSQKRALTYPREILSDPQQQVNFLVMRSMRINSSNNQQYFQTRQAFTSQQGKPIGYEIESTINIYMPNLVENIQQNYEDAQQSLVGQFSQEVVTGNIDAGDIVSRGAGMLVGSVARGVLGQFNDAYQQQQGRIVSQNMVGAYKGPNRRSQTFTFNFHPKDENELKEVADIIKALQLGSLPKKFGDGGTEVLDEAISKISSWANLNTAEFSNGVKQGLVVYEIPPVWILEEVSDVAKTNDGNVNRYTPRFVFGPASITNIRVNKTPDQYWKTFRGTAGDPASIELEVTFSELFALDQVTYLNDMASNVKGYVGGS